MSNELERDEDGRIIIDLNIIGSSREELRHQVITTWLLESPEEKYRYNVETSQDSRRVYLKRPAHLNKGCDFKIFIEEYLYYKKGTEKPPKHGDIINDIRIKLTSHPEYKDILKEAIIQVFQCEEPNDVLQDYRTISFGHGLPFDLLLKALKWFFIEQDVTDWNYSGRKMFYNAIMKQFEESI